MGSFPAVSAYIESLCLVTPLPPSPKLFCCVVCSEALAEHCCGTRFSLRVNRLVSFDSKLHYHLNVTGAMAQIHPGTVFFRRKDDSFDKSHEVGITQAT